MNFLKNRSPLAIFAGAGVVVAILFVVLWFLVPSPPKQIRLATGLPSGLYYHFGERLKSELAEQAVAVEVKSTGGTTDNLSLLNDPHSGVNFALIQGGVADISQYPHLVSVAGLFYEPIWIFYRESAFKNEGGRLQVLDQLKGKRVSVGNEGSGTLSLGTALLKTSGISEQDIHSERLKPDQSLIKLGNGELDAAFIVAAAEAPILSEFYKIPGIKLMSFEQADAYTRHLPYLSKVSVPRGLLSIKHDIPHQDIWVLAPKAELVTHDHTSPATITLLLSASHDILKSYSRLNKPGEFPSSAGLDFPVDADAEIYLKDGPSFLYRYLPFWTAVWIGRFIKIVIPLMVLFIPLFKYIPSVKSFLLRLKFARIYTELRALEHQGNHPDGREESLKKLEEIANRVNHLKVPMMDTRDLFELKRHLGEVRHRLKDRA